MNRYDWPGNVRELENLIERAHILTVGDTLMPQSFPFEVMGETDQIEFPTAVDETTLAEARRVVVEAFEAYYIKNMLTKHKGRINLSAEAAGVGVRQFHKLMQKYNIRKERYLQKWESNLGLLMHFLVKILANPVTLTRIPDSLQWKSNKIILLK